ncbi:hypothetical protein BU25DRAFT_454834 [Macroventuria anomochaeta]|uniref:Uncharacterized protein n=1 Tax=Macroventuria anomochaeta TaxID=301207 RepID=A0ACB6SDI7_9PLEO|nr:uncharacterized protein BU25DRAFT_454834 [Macroventuria anomochaeta]KAF2631379.1 hypothetical protein BU25DRAFT_454834 [Macroventuria anomochaeta]
MGDAKVLAGKLRLGEEEELSRLLDIVPDVVLDVALMKIDKEPTGAVRLLPVTGDDSERELRGPTVAELNMLDKELTLLEVVFVKTADDAPTGVALLLDEALDGTVEGLGDGVTLAAALVGLDCDEVAVPRILLELVEVLKLGPMRVVVVDRLAAGGMLANTLVEGLDVELGSNEVSIDRVPTVELEFPVGAIEPEVGADGFRFDVVGDGTDELVRLPDNTPLDVTGVELVVNEMSGEDDADEISNRDDEDVASVLDVPGEMLGEVGDGIGTTIEDEGTASDSVELAVDSDAEAGSVLSKAIDVGGGADAEELLEAGVTGDVVAVIVIVWPELVCVIVDVKAPGALLLVGCDSDTVKPPLDGVTAELAGVDEPPLESDDCNGGIANDVAPLMMVVAELIDVVICPPSRVDVSVTGDTVVALNAVDAGGVALSTVVEINVTAVVCPPGRVLVTVTSKPEVMGDIRLVEGAGGTALGGVAEMLITVVRPSDRVVIGAVELDAGGRFEPGDELSGGPAIRVVDVLDRIVVCPLGVMLVITRIVLDTVAELLVIDSSDNDGATVTEVLVVEPGDPNDTPGVCVAAEGRETPAVLEIIPGVEGVKFKVD